MNTREAGLVVESAYADSSGRSMIAVYLSDAPGTMVGAISRKISPGGYVTVSGRRCKVIDPGGHCRVIVDRPPRDLMRYGCE